MSDSVGVININLLFLVGVVFVSSLALTKQSKAAKAAKATSSVGTRIPDDTYSLGRNKNNSKRTSNNKSNYNTESKSNELVLTPAEQKIITHVRSDVIGSDVAIDTPFGQRELVYCDYVASGRALKSVEQFIREHVLTTYANTHTEASLTGRRTNLLREQARSTIARTCGVDVEKHAVIFAGSGATAAIDVALRLLPDPFVPLGYASRDSTDPRLRPAVVTGPYEHHSNILPWRESNADVFELSMDKDAAVINMTELREVLEKLKDRPLIIGSFSAASNVDGTLTDAVAVTKLLHEYGALSFFDYASAGPYVRIEVEKSNVDGIFISPHKFVGGPGTPGVLIIRRSVAASKVASNMPPHRPGGGTVTFTSNAFHSYELKLEVREEGGTPEIVGAIRAGAAFKLKEQITPELIMRLEDSLLEKALERLNPIDCPQLCILGNPERKSLPTISFVVVVGNSFLHQNFVCALLNDLFGIQSRSGCACAGPYGQVLLGMTDIDTNRTLLAYSATKSSLFKPGFTRFNLPFFYDEAQIDFLLDAVAWVAEHGFKLMPIYNCDPVSGAFTHCDVGLKKNKGVRTGTVDLDSFDFLNPGANVNNKDPNSHAHLCDATVAKNRKEYFRVANRQVKMVETALRKNSNAFDHSPEFIGDMKAAHALDKLDKRLAWFMRRKQVVDIILGLKKSKLVNPLFMPRYMGASRRSPEDEALTYALQSTKSMQTNPIIPRAVADLLRIVRPEALVIKEGKDEDDDVLTFFAESHEVKVDAVAMSG